MNKGKIVFRTICTVLFLLLTCTKATTQEDQKRIKRWKDDLAKHQTPMEPIKLNYSHSLSEDISKEVFFKGMRNFTVDEKGFVYVSDSQMNTITIFDANGKVIKQIGRQGQGPGEFNNPKAVCIDKSNQIIVLDTNNGRVQFFSPDGVYKNSFRLFVASSKMAELNNKLYLCKSTTKGKVEIVHVLDYKGTELNRFCESITEYGEFPTINRMNISVNDKNEIYLAWELLPIVRKYSESGRLLDEYLISYPTANTRFQRNKESLNDNESMSKKTFSITICDIHAKNDGFYLMWYYPIIEILEYDQSGKLKHIYHADQPYNLIAEGFYVLEKGGEKFFYIANNFPEDKIDIFKTH